MPVSSADGSTDSNGENEACLQALYEAKDALAAVVQLGTADTVQAASIVDEVAGAPCGFSLLAGQFPDDPGELAGYIGQVSGGAESENEPMADGSAATPGLDDDNAEPKFVDCAMAGSGTGTITARILGIKIDESSAAGEWDGADSFIDLTGTAAAVSGNQFGLAGTMYLLTAPLPSTGSSGATCMETTTVTVIEKECWRIPPVWPVYEKCTTRIETTVSLTLCGADAHQDALGLGLITYDHSYIVDGDPCEIGNLGHIDLSKTTGAVSGSTGADEEVRSKEEPAEPEGP